MNIAPIQTAEFMYATLSLTHNQKDLFVKRSEDMIQYCSFSGKETLFFHFKFKTDNKVVRVKYEHFKQSKNKQNF